MSFATPAQWLQRYDARIIGDLVNDTDTPLTPTQLLTDPVTQQMLDDASGDIVLACVPAGRYSDIDLNKINSATYILNGNPLPTPSASTLQRLNCAIAMANCYFRRQYPLEEVANKVGDYLWAQELLEKLRNGTRVFDLPAQVAAGVDANAPMAGTVQLKTGTVTGNINLMSGITRTFGDLNNSPR